jgi:uncharacterized membrane protein YphA (DoxX/SURF4 family)
VRIKSVGTKAFSLTVTLLALLAPIGFAGQQAADTRSYTPPGKLIDIGGYRLHLNCTGGPAVILIAGAGDFSFDWSLVQPRVAAACAPEMTLR